MPERPVRRLPFGSRPHGRLTRAIDLLLAGAALPLAVTVALKGDWLTAVTCAVVCPLALLHYRRSRLPRGD